MILRNHLIKKAVAAGTALLFTATTNAVSLPVFAADIPHSSLASKPALSEHLASLKVPQEFGTITEIFQGSSDRALVFIQDAHALPDAQRNIQKIIEFFQAEFHVSLTALEGASAPLDPQLFRLFPDKTALDKTFDEYLGRGEITGPLASAVLSENVGVYEGVEEWSLYEEGLFYFLQALSQEDALLKVLVQEERELERHKKSVYSGKLHKVDQAVRRFQADKMDFIVLLRHLARIRPPGHKTSLALLLDESRAREHSSQSLDAEVKKLAEEIKGYIDRPIAQRRHRASLFTDSLQNHPSPQPSPQRGEGRVRGKSSRRQIFFKRSIFNQKYQEFQTSQISAQDFALFLEEIIGQYKLPVSVSETLTEHTNKQKRLHDIQGTQLFRDLNDYIGSVKASLFRSEEEKKLDGESRRLELLKKLVKVELGREEWEELKSQETAQPPDASIAGGPAGISIPGLFSAHFAFYRNAEKRDGAFLSNLENLMRRHAERSKRGLLFVAGGFHTGALTKSLQKKGMSYVVVQPRIDSFPDKNLYRAHMRGDVPWKKYFKVENGKVNLYRAFVRAARDQLLGMGDKRYEVVGRREIDSNLTSYFLPPASRRLLLKEWRDKIIRDLAEKNRLTDAGEYTAFIDELIPQGGTSPGVRGRQSLAGKVERFIRRLTYLESANQLTKENVLKLLSPSALVGAADGNILLAAGRSELRANLIPGLQAEGIVAMDRGLSPRGTAAVSWKFDANKSRRITQKVKRDGKKGNINNNIDQWSFPARSELRASGRGKTKEEIAEHDYRRAVEYHSPSGDFSGVDLEHFVHAQNRLAEMLLSETELREVLKYLGIQKAKSQERNYQRIYEKLAEGFYDAKVIDLINGDSYQDPRLAIEIVGQNPNPRAQGVYEAIANSLDALGFNIGQFGKGVKQIIDWLAPTGEDRIDVFTMQKGAAYQLSILRHAQGRYFIQIKKVSGGQFKKLAGAGADQGTGVQVTVRDPIPRTDQEAGRNQRNSQAGMAEGIRRRFPFVSSVEITTQTANDGEPQQVNGFEEKVVIVPSGVSVTTEQKQGEIKVLFSDHSITVIDNGTGMDAKTLSRMFVPKQGTKHPAPLSGEAAHAELAKVRLVHDKSLPHRISFARNTEVVHAADIPQSVSEAASVPGGLMLEFGSLLDVPESRDSIIIPLDLKAGEISNFELAVTHAIHQMIEPSLHQQAAEEAAVEKLKYINTLVIGLDGLIHGNENYAHVVKNLRASIQKEISPLVRRLQDTGYVFFPHDKAFEAIAIPQDKKGPIFLHENLFEWQGAASLSETGGVRVPGLHLGGDKHLPLVVVPFKPERVKHIADFEHLWHTLSEEERLPVIKTDRFIAIPEELGSRAYELAVKRMKGGISAEGGGAFTDDEKKEFLSLVQRVNILTAEEITTTYEISGGRQNILLAQPAPFEPSAGEIDSEAVNTFLTKLPDSIRVPSDGRGRVPSDASQAYIVTENGNIVEIGKGTKVTIKSVDEYGNGTVDAIDNALGIEPLINGYHKVRRDLSMGVGKVNEDLLHFEIDSSYHEEWDGREPIIVSSDKRFVSFSFKPALFDLQTETHFINGFAADSRKEKEYSHLQFSSDSRYFTYLETDKTKRDQHFIAYDLHKGKMIKNIELGPSRHEAAVNPFANVVFIRDTASDMPLLTLVDLASPGLETITWDDTKHLHTDSSGTYTVAVDHDNTMRIYLHKSRKWITAASFDGERPEAIAGAETRWINGKPHFFVLAGLAYEFDEEGNIVDNEPEKLFPKTPDYSEQLNFNEVVIAGGEDEEIRMQKDIGSLDPLQRLDGKIIYKHPHFELFIDRRNPEHPVALDPKTGTRFPFRGKIIDYDTGERKLTYENEGYITAVFENFLGVMVESAAERGFAGGERGEYQISFFPPTGRYALTRMNSKDPKMTRMDLEIDGTYSQVSFDGKYFVFANPKTGDVVYLDPEKPDAPVFVPLDPPVKPGDDNFVRHSRPADAPHRFVIVAGAKETVGIVDLEKKRTVKTGLKAAIRLREGRFILQEENKLPVEGRFDAEGNWVGMAVMEGGMESLKYHNDKFFIAGDTLSTQYADYHVEYPPSEEIHASASGRFSIHLRDGRLFYYDHRSEPPPGEVYLAENKIDTLGDLGGYYTEYLVHDSADIVLLKDKKGQYSLFSLELGIELIWDADHIEIDSSGLIAIAKYGIRLQYINLKTGIHMEPGGYFRVAHDDRYVWVWYRPLKLKAPEVMVVIDRASRVHDFVREGERPVPRFWEFYDPDKKSFWDKEKKDYVHGAGTDFLEWLHEEKALRDRIGLEEGQKKIIVNKEIYYSGNSPTRPSVKSRLEGNTLLLRLDMLTAFFPLQDEIENFTIQDWEFAANPLAGGHVWITERKDGLPEVHSPDDWGGYPLDGLFQTVGGNYVTGVDRSNQDPGIVEIVFYNRSGKMIDLMSYVPAGFGPSDVNGEYFVFTNPDEPENVIFLDPKEVFSHWESQTQNQASTSQKDEKQTQALELWKTEVASRRDEWIRQARQAYLPFLETIPAEFKQEISREIAFGIRRLYEKQEKEIIGRFKKASEGEPLRWDVPPLPTDIFALRMARINALLPSYLRAIKKDLSQEPYGIQEDFYETLFDGLFHLAGMPELEINLEALNHEFFELTALHWIASDRAKQEILDAVPVAVSLVRELRLANNNRLEWAELAILLKFLSMALFEKGAVTTGQIQKILQAKPHVRKKFLRRFKEDFLRAEKESGTADWIESALQHPEEDYDVGPAEPYFTFFTHPVEQLRERRPLIPKGKDLALRGGGVEISQIIKLEQQRPKKGEDDLVMEMDYLITNLHSLPERSEALEAEILKNTKVQREGGAYTAEIAQNSLDATRGKKGALVIDFYLQKASGKGTGSGILRAPSLATEYVEEASDNGTGALQEAALLIPKSTKAGGRQMDLAGFFGTGKYTIFEGVDRLEIITKNQDRAFMFTFTVIKDSSDAARAIRLTGIRIVKDKRVPVGVTVRRIKQAENTLPELDQMLSVRAWKTFAGLAQHEDFSIYSVDHEGERKLLKVEKEILSEADFKAVKPGESEKTLFGKLRILAAKDMPLQIIDKAGLRVSDMKPEYFELIPLSLRKHIRELGVVIQIPLPLIRNRSAFEHENEYLPVIQKYVATEFYKALAYKTLTQTSPQFVFENFPHDWETSPHDDYWENVSQWDKTARLARDMNSENYDEITHDDLIELLAAAGHLDKQKRPLKLILMLEVAKDRGHPDEKTSLLLQRAAVQMKIKAHEAQNAVSKLQKAGVVRSRVPEAAKVDQYDRKVRMGEGRVNTRKQMAHVENYVVDPQAYDGADQALVKLASSIARHFGIEQVILVEKDKKGEYVTFAGAFKRYQNKRTFFLARSITSKAGRASGSILDQATDTVIHELAHYLEELMRHDDFSLLEDGFVAHETTFTHDAVGTFAEAMKYAAGTSLARHSRDNGVRPELREATHDIIQIFTGRGLRSERREEIAGILSRTAARTVAGVLREGIKGKNRFRDLGATRTMIPVIDPRVIDEEEEALIQTLRLKDAEQKYTIGLILPEETKTMPGSREEKLLGVLKEGRIETLALEGRPSNRFVQLLKDFEINLRPVDMTRPVLIPGQKVLPIAVPGAGAWHPQVLPFLVEGSAAAHPLVQDYSELLEMVTLVHAVQILGEQPELRLEPSKLRTELLKRLALFESGFDSILRVVREGDRFGFVISASVARAYLEHQSQLQVKRSA